MNEPDSQDPEETVREAVERSRSGAPAVGAVVRDRFTADEVFQRIVAAADEEITSGSRELFFSGLAAGFAISITFLLYASMTAATDGHPIFSVLLYPLGFVYIIIGGYQLYTENTLPPVALTLERLASLPALLRHWVIVLIGNFAGGVFGATLLAYGGVFDPASTIAAIEIAEKGAYETSWWSLFYKAGFAGLIVAGVVWLDYAARDTISRILVVYLAFLAIPLGDLFHVVVSFTEMLYLFYVGDLAILYGMTHFVLPVLLGNTIGGVALVTIVNYFQTTEHRLESARFAGADRQLTIREWFLGGFVGRTYVPVIHTAGAEGIETPDTDRIMVPIGNPRTESNVAELAAILARQRENAMVHLVHIVQLPDRPGVGPDVSRTDEIVDTSKRQLGQVEDIVADYEVDVETSTVVSEHSFEELLDTTRRHHADLVVMGWGEDRPWSAGSPDRPVGELASDIPCDFLVFRDRGLDFSKILIPTAGGPSSDLAGEVARDLRDAVGSELTLQHVVDSPADREVGEEFLAEWAADHGFGDARLTVDDSGQVDQAIIDEAPAHTMVMLGATERGLLSRLVTDSVHTDVFEDVDCSVVLAERK